jgi:cytosine/adenosine deaminase-related metal-dependent hydrolase
MEENMEVELLVTNGTLVTMNPQRDVIEDGAIAINEGKILEIGATKILSAKYEPKHTINATKKAVLPGFIDTHGHAGHTLVKTVGAHLNGFGWRTMIDHIYFRSTTEDYWYADGLLSSIERLRFGTTFGTAILGSAPRSDNPIYGQRYIDGVAEVGIRGILGIGPPRPPWPKKFSHWTNGKKIDQWVTLEECFETTEELISKSHGSHDGKILVWVSASRFSLPSPYDPMFDESQLDYAFDQANRIREIADKYHTGIHTHAYGGVISSLEKYLPHVLGPDLLLAHCTGVSEDEVDILNNTGTKVSHCPTARRIYTFPAPVPVVEMIDKGVVVAIGSDGSSPDRSFDLFKDMRTAMLIQRLRFTDPWLMPPGKLLEMVTIDAAKAVGMEDTIGSLEVGKDADIILVDLNKAHIAPIFMIPYRLVHEVNGQDVDTVIVQGKVLMEDNVVKTVDEEAVLNLAQEEAENAVERGGVEPLMGLPEGFWGQSRY